MLGHLERRFGPFYVTIKLRYYNISFFFLVVFFSRLYFFSDILINDVKQIWFVISGCCIYGIIEVKLVTGMKEKFIFVLRISELNRSYGMRVGIHIFECMSFWVSFIKP